MIATTLDHLILGIRDLDQGRSDFFRASGLHLQVGGKHPFGTHNALCSLERGIYLEVIAPQDPVHPPDTVFSPGNGCPELFCFGWSLRTDSILDLMAALDAAGIAHSPVGEGSRKTPDGRVLAWKTLFLLKDGLPTLQPFFIEWGEDSVHPSESTPPGCTLEQVVVGWYPGHPLDESFFPKDKRIIWEQVADPARHGIFTGMQLNTPKGLITFG